MPRPPLRACMLQDPRPRPMMVVTGDKDGDEPTRTVRAVRGDDTEEVPVDIALTPVVVDGTMLVMMTLVDGTEHPHMLTTMAQRNAALAAAEYRKTMLSTLSHELRTPLVGVMGNLEVLATMPMPPAQQDAGGSGVHVRQGGAGHRQRHLGPR